MAGQRQRKPTVVIQNPEIEELGPAMLALSEVQRRFVVAYAMSSNATDAARSAGYSDTNGIARIRAHHLLQSEKVNAALKEWTERALYGNGAYVAVSALIEMAADPEHKKRFEAADSLADRVGFARQTNHQVSVEHVDSRSTEDLLDAIWRYAEAKRSAAPRLAKPVEHLDTRETLCSTRSDEAEAAGKSGKDKKEQAAWRDGVQPVQEAAAAGRAILPRVPRGVA